MSDNMCEHGGLDGNCLRCKDATIAALRAENTILKALRDELFDRNVALRAEVEEWRRLYERAEASIQYGYAPEADQLRSQLSARRRRRAGLERGEEVPAAHQGE